MIQTKDGSASIEVEGLDETYHSRHGAVQESMHIFIGEGLHRLMDSLAVIRVFEVGFGTGLNALLTFQALRNTKVIVEYTGLEAYPITEEEAAKLNYTGDDTSQKEFFHALHAKAWDVSVRLHPQFTLVKRLAKLHEFEGVAESADLIYYDAFGPRAQPKMWLPEHFEKMYRMLSPGGVLVTYCAKGQVRRDLEAAGFKTERLPGPPGKREMLRATKP